MSLEQVVQAGKANPYKSKDKTMNGLTKKSWKKSEIGTTVNLFEGQCQTIV